MNQTALRTGIDYYLDPQGKLVFTAKYLRDRGYCCRNGCRHCPYGYENLAPRADGKPTTT